MDYEKIGLKSGIEIHAQINSGKLFCRCPSNLVDKEPKFKFKRRLKSVVSEVGEKDIVAEFEIAKDKYAVYESPTESACLIEADEEPIKEMDENAFETALQVCLMLNANIVDVFQVMRKQVLDFSNTSSFQRTGIIALNGKVKTTSGEANIDTISIEEDAARKIKEKRDHVVYRLDRLGFPLIEIATGPNMKSPEQVKEVAEYLGMVLKSTGKIKSGIGTIRQDLNVSIKGHPRVEIKGVQNLRAIPKIIKKEAERQLKELNGKKKPENHVRKVNSDNTTSYLRPLPGAARMYVETDHPPIRIDENILKKIKIPELTSEKVLHLEKKYDINAQLASEVIKREIDFGYFVNKFKNMGKDFLAHVLVEVEKEIKTRFNSNVKLSKKDFEEVLSHYDKKEINREAVFDILVKKAKGKKINYKEYKSIPVEEIGDEVKKLVKNKKDLSDNALMGILMKKYRGKVEAKKLMSLIKKNK